MPRLDCSTLLHAHSSGSAKTPGASRYLGGWPAAEDLLPPEAALSILDCTCELPYRHKLPYFGLPIWDTYGELQTGPLLLQLCMLWIMVMQEPCLSSAHDTLVAMSEGSKTAFALQVPKARLSTRQCCGRQNSARPAELCSCTAHMATGAGARSQSVCARHHRQYQSNQNPAGLRQSCHTLLAITLCSAAHALCSCASCRRCCGSIWAAMSMLMCMAAVPSGTPGESSRLC